jgi:hypothetical protein
LGVHPSVDAGFVFPHLLRQRCPQLLLTRLLDGRLPLASKCTSIGPMRALAAAASMRFSEV